MKKRGKKSDLGSVKKSTEIVGTDFDGIKKSEKVMEPSSDRDKKDGANKKLSILLAGMGGLIVCLIVVIVAIIIVRGNSVTGENESEDEEVVYASPVYEGYDKLAEEFSIALAEMDNPTTTEILALYQTYIDRADNEEVRAMLMIDYYMIMMSGDLGGGQKTEILDGLVAADAVVKSVKSASAVAMAADLYNDEELKIKYQALADARAFGTEETDDGSDNEGENDSDEAKNEEGAAE